MSHNFFLNDWNSLFSDRQVPHMQAKNTEIFYYLGSSGLRGDDEFKQELAESFENFDFSSNPETFNKTLDHNFGAIINRGVVSECGHFVFFKHYNQHGMSAGRIILSIYKNVLIPELKEKYREIYKKII